MAFSKDDFNKVWASTSPLTPYEFSENNYKQGWDFVGGTPPSRQMWDYLQKLTDEKIKYIYNNMIPCGVVQTFAGNTVPDGWLLCDGSAVSRTDYADLYSVIGDTYGAGDGTSTFNLPSLIDKFIEGSATSGTEHTAGLPDITGIITPHGGGVAGNGATFIAAGRGAFIGDDLQNNFASGSSLPNATSYGKLLFAASRSNDIYGASDTVQPPSVAMRYIIKY